VGHSRPFGQRGPHAEWKEKVERRSGADSVSATSCARGRTPPDAGLVSGPIAGSQDGRDEAREGLQGSDESRTLCLLCA